MGFLDFLGKGGGKYKEEQGEKGNPHKWGLYSNNEKVEENYIPSYGLGFMLPSLFLRL